MGHSDPHTDFGQEYFQGSLRITIFLEYFFFANKLLFDEF